MMMTIHQIPAALSEKPQATRVRHQPVEELLAPKTRMNFPMRGFDAEFADIVDYIFKITHRIWAERSVGQIYDYYDHVCVVYTPFEITRSVEDVVTGTISMMQSFPDRESRFINVSWSGDDEQGYYTSHLGFSQMTNLGPSIYGPATGRKVKIHHIADCVLRDNRIFLEWLVRDNGGLVRQLGLDPHVIARGLAERDAAAGRKPWFIGVPERAPGQALPKPLDRAKETLQDRFAHLLHDVWNRRRFDALKSMYAPNVVVHAAGGREIVGLEGLTLFLIQFIAAFPDAVFQIEHVCDSDESDGTFMAVRWSVRATHRGDGIFGLPTGKPVYVLGISQFRLENQHIVEEWTLFDEIAILRQCYATT
jgi:predicted ester cyclase